MKMNLAPYVSAIRRKFCPDEEVAEEVHEYIWIRNRATGQLEVSSHATGEKKYHHTTNPRKVFQSYVLGNLSDYSLRAIAVVNEGATGNINIDGWEVSLIDVQTEFGARLIKSTLFVTINDENNAAHFVANIGGGVVLTAADYLAEKSRRSWEQKMIREGRLPQQSKGKGTRKIDYSLTTADAEWLLSPANSSYIGSSKQVKVLQVYTLLSREMKIYVCAVIDKAYGWLHYNSAGCCEHKVPPQLCTVTDYLTAVEKDSILGDKLLGSQEIGGTIVINQKPFLMVNIGGGPFELHHEDWQEEKQEIKRRLGRRFDES